MEKIEFFEKMTNTLLSYKLVVQEITLVIGVFGNLIALIVILSSTKFQTLTGFYLLNLSIADLLILSTSLFFSLYLSQFKFLDFDKPAHYFSEWIFQSSVIVSTSIVTAFTVERYLAICHPFFVNSLPKKSRVRKIILTIWLIAVSLAVLPVAQLIIQINELVPLAPNNPVLIENQHLWPYISTFWAIFYFFVPMAVITILYILIWLKLRHSSKDKSIIGSRANRADNRTLAMFVTIIATFIFSWAPYYINKLLLAYMLITKISSYDHAGHHEFLILQQLYFLDELQRFTFPLSSAINPMIYVMMSKNFRAAFKDVLLKIRSYLTNLLKFIHRSKRSNIKRTHS